MISPSARLGMLPAWDSVRSVDAITESPCSPDTDQVTAQTLTRMASLVGAGQASPAVVNAARAIARRLFGRTDRRSIACAIWHYVRSRVRFVLDGDLLDQLGQGEASELLIAPWLLLSMADPRGDCDDFSCLIASLLCVFRIPCEFVTVAADPADSKRFSHVYVYAVLEDGTRFPLDASHGPEPGWEVPRVFRRATFPLLFAPVSDAERGSRLNGLPAGYALEQSVLYGPQRTRRPSRRIRPRGMAGMGDTSSGFDWDTFSQTLANDTSSVLSSVLPVALAQPGTIVQQSAAGTTIARSATGSTSLPLSMSGSGSTLLILGGLALVALMMMEKR